MPNIYYVGRYKINMNLSTGIRGNIMFIKILAITDLLIYNENNIIIYVQE